MKKTVHKRNRRNKACEPALHTRARQEAYKDESRYMRGSKRVDSVGMQLMPNGLLTGYKRKRKKRRKGSRAERTKCCRTDFGASLSLLLSLSSAPSRTCAGFEEARAVSWNAPSASCSTSDLFSPFCASRHTGIGICSPPCSFSLVSISCPTVGCNILLCYLFAFISTYSLLFLPVSLSIRVLCVEGPCPCAIRGRA